MTVKKVPTILQECLSLTENDRKLLNVLAENAPSDTTQLYLPTGNFGGSFLSVKELAKKLRTNEQSVRDRLEHIRVVWNIPEQENLPTNNNTITLEDALIRAVLNQHILRFDNEIQDYRVPRIHFYSSELGIGQLYTNNKAFRGERIFRKAMGYNEVMNSYHLQGGVMPELIFMFGKQKNQRALLTGLNQSGAELDLDEINYLEMLIESVQEKPLTAKQEMHIRENFARTLDSMEEAAKSSAYELAPLLTDIPTYVPIHIYYSYNDDSNLSEIEDHLISRMRKIHQKMKEASDNLPNKRDNLNELRSKKGIINTYLQIVRYLVQSFGISKKAFSTELFQQKMRNLMLDEEDTYTKSFEVIINEAKNWYLENIEKDETSFYNIIFSCVDQLLAKAHTLHTLRVEIKKGTENYQKVNAKIVQLEAKIAELEQFELAFETEQRSGHSWFTKVIAIKPTEAKVNEMLKKELYRNLYKEIMLPELQLITGKKHDIHVHTDREITVYVPDPMQLLDKHTYPDNKLYGTTITAIPRTNRQRSNEPLLESTFELQKKHECSIATRLKLAKKRPTTIQKFNKRESCFSDVVWTSYGADGFRLQPKLVVAPTMVAEEYEHSTEIVYYLKTPTRHDTKKMGDQMKRGNKGTWAAKRVDKGGPTTGQVMQIRHADGSNEWFFFDDDFYENIADTYGDCFEDIEHKLEKAKLQKKSIKEYSTAYKNLCEKICVDLRYILLANDIHLGSYTMPGRPSNIDMTKASTEVALQTLGYGAITSMQGSEFLHGHLKFGSYDSSYEGLDINPLKLGKSGVILLEDLRKHGVPYEKILELLMLFIEENEYSRAVFKVRDQKEMFAQFLKPIMTELMDRGCSIFLGAGNHWNSSNKYEDEVSAIASVFDDKYRDSGKLIYRHSGGQSYSLDVVSLPANVPIRALIAHKMRHGKTEISAIMDQAVGTKQNALFVITADRHHSGMIAEKERFGILDTGKQSVMPYVMAIGKASSTRGMVALGYSPNRDLCYSARFWMDDVVHKLTGWNRKARLLSETHKIIKKTIYKS